MATRYDKRRYRLDAIHMRDVDSDAVRANGWCYFEGANGLSVYIEHDGFIFSARIPRKNVLAYARRAERDTAKRRKP